MQPSEFFKIGYIFFMAYWISKRKEIIATTQFLTQFAVINGAVFLVLLSGVCYAVYLVLVSTVKRINQQNSQKLTFYVLMFSGAFFMLSALQGGGLQIIPSASAGINLLLMATLPTLLSNLALVRSVKNIGSTLTSVLGAMEPLTAIIVGILVFDESLRGLMVVGIILILVSVSLIVLSPLLDKRIAERLQRLARNKPVH